jgi:uncharacterized membrane protein YfcA
MTFETILFLSMGAAAGGFINGLAGTGTALFALGFYLVVLPPIQSVAIVALMSILAGVQGLWIVRTEIRGNLGRIVWFLVPGLLGVPIGLALLALVDSSDLRIAIACLLIVYGLYFGLRKSLPSFSRETPLIDGLAGFIGGAFGGAAGVSGAIPAMWLSIRPWPKAVTRAVLQSFNMVILTTTVTLLFAKGAYNNAALSALIITLPVGLLAAQIGIFVFKRLSDGVFRRLLIVLTLLMGTGILLGELF